MVHNNTNITDVKERRMLSHYLGRNNKRGTIRLVRNAFKPENIATPKAAPTFERKYDDTALKSDPKANLTPREWR